MHTIKNRGKKSAIYFGWKVLSPTTDHNNILEHAHHQVIIYVNNSSINQYQFLQLHTFRMRDIKDVPSKDKASSAASFLMNSMYADLNKKSFFQKIE